jgi:hypothetical protein
MENYTYILCRGYMKKILLSLLFLTTVLFAQNNIYQYRILQPVGGASATGNTGFFSTSGLNASYASLTWSLIGSLATCTIQVDYSNDGVTVAGQLISSQTCTSSGTNTAGVTSTPAYVRVSYTIGTGGGYLNFVDYGCNNSTCTAGGGSGSGTVNTGTTGQIGVYPGSGTTIGPDSLLTDNGATLTYTGTNYIAPNGSTTVPGYTFNSYNTTGISACSANILCALSNGITVAIFTGGIEITSSGAYKASQTGAATGAVGASIGTTGSGTTEAWSVNSSNNTGLILQNQCKVNGAITLSTSPTTICSWTLPNAAQTWSWFCHGSYSITAGTTPEISLGMNASQAPTTETGHGLIGSIGSSVSAVQAFTYNSATSTSAGNVPFATPTVVLTTVTDSPFQAWGIIQASATSGTFAITALLSGTTPAGTIVTGTICNIE